MTKPGGPNQRNIKTMPDELPITDPNAEIKAKLEAQNVEKVGGATAAELVESGDALDALAKLVEKKEEPLPAAPDPVPPGGADGVPGVDGVPSTDAEKAEAERAAASKRSEEFFKDSPALPQGSSPKASEAFSAIKIKAAQEISARESELEETRKKLAEAEAKLSAAPDPAVQKELEDHRQWRAKLDVDADPKFKEFDKQVAASHEFIYAQLKKSPAITAEVIDQIKKLGGPENVNLDKIFASVQDSTLQRIVESKVADIEMLKFNKEQAISSAKKNIDQYIEEQRKSYAQNVGAHNDATKARFSELTKKLTWFADKSVDSKADEPARKSAETHNKFVADTKQQLDAALQDDSPEMRAIMLTGMAQLIYLQRVHESAKAELTATKKELVEAKIQLEKFTGASVSRLRETGARPGGNIAAAPKENWNSHAGDALDAIARQITEERARKASS